jgi:hypothetical protein
MSGTFSVTHGVYRSEWPGPTFVRMDIDHIHQSSRDGEITAEVRVISTAPVPMAGIIHQARFTVTGTRSRSELAKHCGTRTPGQDIDWNGLIEWAAVKTIAAFRQGEPPTYINEAPRPLDDGYLVPPVVLGRLPTVWFGDGGVGKSALALAAAVSIQTGEPVLGQAPTNTTRVAVLDWEMDAWEHRKRLEGICLSLDIEMPKVLHVPCRTAIWNDTERLQGILANYEIGFVVIDSVGMACAGLPLTSDEAAIRFYTAVRQLEIGSLCIAHRTKAEDGDQYPFGSIFWHNQARSTWYIRKAQEPGQGILEVAMHQRKANTGGLEMPVGFRLLFGEKAIQITRQARGDSVLLMETSPVSVRMGEFLKAGPATVAQIANELGVKESAVRAAYNRSKSSGKFMEWVHNGERKIGLAAS